MIVVLMKIRWYRVIQFGRTASQRCYTMSSPNVIVGAASGSTVHIATVVNAAIGCLAITAHMMIRALISL